MLDTEFTWCADRRNFVKDGKRYVGSEVATEGENVWVEAWPPGMSAHVYTERHYAFATHMCLVLHSKKGDF